MKYFYYKYPNLAKLKKVTRKTMQKRKKQTNKPSSSICE